MKYEIEVPDGYKVVQDGTTIKLVKEEKKELLTWEEIQEYNRSKNKLQYWINGIGDILDCKLQEEYIHISHTSQLIPSVKAAKKVLALCQLLIIAEYYNDGWEPDWESNEFKYFVYKTKNGVGTGYTITFNIGEVFFKTGELAQKAYNNNKQIFHDYFG